MRTKVPGGDWSLVRSKLEAIYGKTKRVFVWRMMTAAIALPPSVVQSLELRKIPNHYICENKF
eukprot:5646395-Lingulodinium_polyedra.AAC.1